MGPLLQFSWGIFWAVLCALLAALAIYGLGRWAISAIRQRRAEVRDPNYLVDQAFQGKHAFKPAAPLDKHTEVAELAREYKSLRDLETATAKSHATAIKNNPAASREEMIDAAVNAFTAGAFTKEQMEAMIREANSRR